MLAKIISGGQTGADQGGLRAARRCGLATGGWLPRGCLTLNGPDPGLAAEFGLRETTSAQYQSRTRANVREADGTLRFARHFGSRGERCTRKALRQYGKPYLDIDIDRPLPVEDVRHWLRQHHIRVLNVAGNSEQRAPGITAFVVAYLTPVLAGPDDRALLRPK